MCLEMHVLLVGCVLIMRKTLSVLICFVLKSILSDTEVVRPACFFVIFAWNNFSSFYPKVI